MPKSFLIKKNDSPTQEDFRPGKKNSLKHFIYEFFLYINFFSSRFPKIPLDDVLCLARSVEFHFSFRLELDFSFNKMFQ